MNLTNEEAAKVIAALERASAMIGCPPGDNATADTYRECVDALAILTAAKDRQEPAGPDHAGELFEPVYMSGPRYSAEHDHMEFCRGLVKAQPDETLADAIERTIASYAYPPQPAVEQAATLGISEAAQVKLDRVNGLLAAKSATPPAPKALTYSMSKNYDKLYAHLLNGGEALGYGHVAEYPDEVTRRYAVSVRAITRGENTMVDMAFANRARYYYTKPDLITECANINLEWLAPATVDVDAAADAVYYETCEWLDRSLSDAYKAAIHSRLNALFNPTT